MRAYTWFYLKQYSLNVIQRQPKASVTLIANQIAPLTDAQQIGIQKMVANAVDGMLIESVTLLNQQGVALSASDNSDKAIN